MKRIAFLLMLTHFLANCTNSQIKHSPTQLSGELTKDINILVPNGSHTVAIMDGVRQSPRQAALMKKFQDTVKSNYQWFIKYMKTVPEGEPMPYHPKLGLSKEEYEELMNDLNNTEIVSSGEETITITVKNDTVYFKSKGKLSNYNFLKIDLKHNEAIYNQYTMPFADTVNITDAKNGLRSKWKGYSWKFEQPKDLNFDNLKNLDTVKLKQYEFTIGRLERNGKTYMSIKGREVEDGIKTVEFERPVVF